MSELKAGVIVTPHNEGMSFNRDSDHVSVTEGETEFYLKSEADKVIAEMKAEKEALLVKFRKFIDDHCAVIVTATRAVENLSPNIQMDFYEEFIKEDK